MLPKNYKVTELVKAISTQDSTAHYLESNYRRTLNEEDNRFLDRILNIHRTAQVRPHVASYPAVFSTQNFTAQANRPESTQSQSHPQHIHIHIHNNRPNSLWYDWFFWRMLVWDMRLFSTPAPQRKRKDGEPNHAQVFLALILGIGAAVSSLYSLIEIGRCVEQLSYAEDIFANLSRITLGALGAVAGGVGGYALGAIVLSMPIVGVVIGALITAGVSIGASKLLIESVHRKNPSESALDYDPRFCLSPTEERALRARGYDTLMVSEAIREVAIAYDEAHKKTWSLTFWSDDNRNKAVLTTLLRELKSGSENYTSLDFKGKVFDLMCQPALQSHAMPQPEVLYGSVVNDFYPAYQPR